jgi:hypothetical protein
MEGGGSLPGRFGEKGGAEQLAIHRAELDQIVDVELGVHHGNILNR